MRIKWLHLSDIHFNYRNFDSRLLRKDFIDRIKRISESEKFTHLFLTGDILYKYNSNNESANETAKFINDLIIAMCIDSQNVFIVPGNHDHNRGSTIIDDIYSNLPEDEKVCEKIRLLTTAQIEELMNSFEKFSEVYKIICGSNYYSGSGIPHTIINKCDLSIIKINTSWLDLTSDSEKSLYCDTDRLLSLLEENEDVLKQGVNIAIGHHQLDEFALPERERLLNMFQRYNIGLYFCGHAHQPSIKYFWENDVLQLVCTGGFVDGYSEGGYVFGFCDTDNDLYKAEFYNWNNGSWYIDSSLDGTNERGICYFNTRRFKHNSNIVAVDFKLYDGHISRKTLSKSIGCDNFDILVYPHESVDQTEINWELHEKNTTEFCKDIKCLIEDDKQVHIYPLAPIPLLIKLGFELQKNSMLSIHQYSRKDSSWILNDEDEEIRFNVKKDVKKGKKKKNNDLVVKISTSYRIDNRLIDNTFSKSTYDTLEFTATKIEQGSPIYRKDVIRLVDIIFQHLNEIANSYDKIHLIAAVPAGMAVEIGRCLLKSVFYNVYTYHLCYGKYCKALIINKFEDDKVSVDNNVVYIDEYQQNMVSVPIVGKIACGDAFEPVCDIDEYMQIPKSILGSGEYFILRASGDSMIDAGIDDGDLVLIRQQSIANNGQIVVALIENETTLKRFYRDDENKQIILKPENKQYEEKRYRNVQIQGIAVNVIKDL